MHVQATTPFIGGAEAAWRVLMDFPAYADWNPFVVRAQTQDRRNITITVDPEADERMLGLVVRIDKANAPEEVSGALLYGAPFLLGGRYRARLDEASGALIQEVDLTGVLRPLYVSRRFQRLLERGLNAMGAALAQRCKALA
ncbi:MAG: hypothetical protein JNK94_04510 [Hyphomonadaceae bacterium]|nr:hypothetical protein [Hyphomonadaceae bacterium]MBX3510989.1 hypothetical protein [Hyphomonadaceae bacterium]